MLRPDMAHEYPPVSLPTSQDRPSAVPSHSPGHDAGATHYTREQWRQLWRPAGPDLQLLYRFDRLNYDDLSIEDGLRAFYYQFSVALKYRGVNLLDDPHLDAEAQAEYHWTLVLASHQVAADILCDQPNDVVAQRLRDDSIDAPLATHLDFFNRIWGKIALFLESHPPTVQPSPPDISAR